jgi:DnaJ-domain-containing protein 1/ketosteroid isomerase-like protein
MDRRDGAETTGVHTDEQLKKALAVIGLSYRGAAPEVLFAQAIHCFEGLMDISRDTEAARDFARRRELDIKYLVDGANFVISKMHFNPEENFYVTLGLPMDTTPEELKQRWKKLMLLYHPDRQTGDEEWVSERAKKVNEAYSTLKDDARRLEYDRRLSETQQNNRHPSYAQQHTAEPYRARQSKQFRPLRSRSYRESSAWDQFRKYLPKAMIGIYVLAAGVFLLYIYQQNRSSTLESELSAPGQLRHQMTAQEQAPEAEPPIAPAPARPATLQKEKIIVPSALPAERPSPFVAAGGMGPERTAPSPKETRNPDAPAITPELRTENRGAILSAVSSPAPAAAVQEKKPEPEQRPPEQGSPELQRSPARQEQPSPAITEAGSEQPRQPRVVGITREEVDAFMQRYIRAYTQSDIEGFMTLFSPAAVENNTMRYQEIRNAYRETFREKITDYRIQNMDIRTDGQKATVSGTYSMNRYRSVEGRWVRHTGRITWRLARENSQLKIMSTNYDN